MKTPIALAIAIATLVSACATPPRFEYGAYESSLYAYFKKPELRDKYESALEKAIEKGEKSDRIAPGLYAELGFLRLQSGDDAAAIALFEKERDAFPESHFFMSKVIDRIGGEETKVLASDADETPAPDADAETMTEAAS